MSWSVTYARSARKALRRLPNEDRRRVADRIEALRTSQPNLDIKRLSARDKTERLRVGDYRIIFRYDFPKGEIEIEQILRRSETTYRVLAWLALWGLG